MNSLGRVYVGARDWWTRFGRKGPVSEVERFKREALSGTWPSQQQTLSSMLRFAATNVPYYRDLAANIRNVEDLSQWPVLTKDIMREVGDALKSDDHEHRICSENTSGGSTGRPVRFVHDQVFRDRAEATRQYHAEKILGLNRNMSQVVLWGSTRDIFTQTPERLTLKERLRGWAMLKLGLKTTILNAFRMKAEDLDGYLETINKEQPEVIHSYAGSLYQLAKHARDRGLTMHSPRCIYTTAETLRPFMRETIEAVFHCHVFDLYGSREVGLLAAEGPGGHLYTFDFFNHVEIVDENNEPVPPGHEGRILVTTLHNHAMPFIRYEIGDLAVRGLPSTALGPQLGTLERICGRVTDQFLSPDGSLVHGQYFVRLLFFCDWLDELQITQHALDKITITYVPLGEPDPATLSDVEDKIRLVMGKDCSISWEKVEKIPRTQEGKLMYTRCLVQRNLQVQEAVDLDDEHTIKVNPSHIILADEATEVAAYRPDYLEDQPTTVRSRGA